VKNASFVFLAWLTSPDINLRWAEFSSYIAVHYSTIKDNEKMAQIYDTLPEMTVVYDHIDLAVEKVKNKYYETVGKTYYNALGQIFCENADFDTTWNAMVSEMNYTLSGN
jgi:hypothetical protein